MSVGAQRKMPPGEAFLLFRFLLCLWMDWMWTDCFWRGQRSIDQDICAGEAVRLEASTQPLVEGMLGADSCQGINCRLARCIC